MYIYFTKILAINQTNERSNFRSKIKASSAKHTKNKLPEYSKGISPKTNFTSNLESGGFTPLAASTNITVTNKFSNNKKLFSKSIKKNKKKELALPTVNNKDLHSINTNSNLLTNNNNNSKIENNFYLTTNSNVSSKYKSNNNNVLNSISSNIDAGPKIDQYRLELNQNLLNILAEERRKEDERENLYRNTHDYVAKAKLENIFALERTQASVKIMKYNE